MTRIHLDTDIGGDLDDLCALAMLLAWPRAEIAGVTTVVENDGKRAGYARFALDLAGHTDVPVAAGAEAGSGWFREAYGLPPEPRYWPEPVTPLPGPLDAALDLLQASVESGATIIAIGPLTNLSCLERRTPGILRTATLCMMGGSIRPALPGFPAWDLREDFNLQADRFAAKHVLDAADASRLTIVPIEMTAQTALREAHLPRLRRGNPLARLIARQGEAWIADYQVAATFGPSCPGLPPDIVNFLHDPLACAVALGWDGATVESLPLSVELQGEWVREIVDPRGRPYRVVTQIEQKRFNEQWAQVVAGTG
ncbi:MAG TPA: nucleoside hydrolase [Chloroflexota bacterium]|nr:nucleoside hydrolase [Chloroflexota bacterium]